jgi:hypothetical protein
MAQPKLSVMPVAMVAAATEVAAAAEQAQTVKAEDWDADVVKMVTDRIVNHNVTVTLPDGSC